MSLLLSRHQLQQRSATLSPSLRALAASLRDDLNPLIGAELFVPREKARLTRRGGRCRVDGALLDFEPMSPRQHRCPRCGRVFEEEDDYRWWVVAYQLWLAERAVHGACLWALVGDEHARALSESILETYATTYLEYPNGDNVLGPTRPFFSTYLESIWLLQIIIASSMLESSGESRGLAARVRDRIVEPSANLIGEYDEGDSNRQVWNNAALAAAGHVLGRDVLVERALLGPSGLVRHLGHGLLADGSWYEGENYHLFAHRGLWYGIWMADCAAAELPPELVDRFEQGFVTPFLTALPDFTFPARRDSQYRVSLRQWRTAESCELALARSPESRDLQAALGELYRLDLPPGETGRARSTAEAERNVPGALLTRSDLGWKALLFALPELPQLAGIAPRSAILPAQGYGVIRRQDGVVYAALDYGHPGAGHGHPDRLNAWLVVGNDRVLEDVGTGSYVERALHWYRSTLAHNAPLVNGVSQDRVHGRLIGWDDDGKVGWIVAEADIAHGVLMRRSLVVLEDHAVDTLSWVASGEVTVDLPVHARGELSRVSRWLSQALAGGSGEEDGFEFLREAARAEGVTDPVLHAAGVHGRFHVPERAEWWRATAPAAPGEPDRPFHLIRVRSDRGVIRQVWSWQDSVLGVEFEEQQIRIRRLGGKDVTHASEPGGWFVDDAGDRRVLRELRPPGAETSPSTRAMEWSDTAPSASGEIRAHTRAPALTVPYIADAGDDRLLGDPLSAPPRVDALRFSLGRRQYRRSESSWEEAGSPRAEIALHATGESLLIDIDVKKAPPVFAPPQAENPLDNEHPDINSDGVQLHLATAEDVRMVWLLVPEHATGEVRVTPRSESAAKVFVAANWRLTSDGWRIGIAVPRSALGADAGVSRFRGEIVVNEIPPGRERRRGQLVLSGAEGEWIYLRGDREDPDHFLAFVIAHA